MGANGSDEFFARQTPPFVGFVYIEISGAFDAVVLSGCGGTVDAVLWMRFSTRSAGRSVREAFITSRCKLLFFLLEKWCFLCCRIFSAADKNIVAHFSSSFG